MQRADTHLNFLDGFRGVAILSVFLFHCYGLTYGWHADPAHFTLHSLLLSFHLGAIGVAIFFAISGFCIHFSHQRSRQKDFTTFYTRRFFRLYPPYLAALLIFGFLPPWHSIHFRGSDGTVQMISHLFLVHNLNESTYFAISIAFWSIAVEVQLYLLYPLLLGLVQSLTWARTLWITFAIEATLRLGTGIYIADHHAEPTGWLIGLPFGYWFSWAIGAAAAEAFLQDKALPFSRLPLWLLPLLAVGIGAVAPLSPFAFTLAAMATVRAFTWFLAAPRPGDQSPTSWLGQHLRFAGIISYSVYLLHLPFLGLLKRLLADSSWQPQPLTIFVLLVASWLPILAVGWCFYRLLELPSIALGKRVAPMLAPKTASTR